MTRKKREEQNYRLSKGKGNALPFVEQIKRFVIDKIEGGAWPEGHRMPPEGKLAEMFGTARMTVHSALRDLADQGVLLRRPGAGTFVAARKPQSTFLEIRNIRDEIAARGHRYTAEVHLLAAEPSDLSIATELNSPPGTEVFHSVIVHKEDGRPIQIENRYVNPAFAPDYLKQDFTVVTPNEYLMSIGPLEAAEHIIQATTAEAATRELLEMPRGEPVLLLRRRTWSKGVIVTSVRLIHPGSRFSLVGHMTLKRGASERRSA